jgi:hypothetical protein
MNNVLLDRHGRVCTKLSVLRNEWHNAMTKPCRHARWLLWLRDKSLPCTNNVYAK